METKKSFKADLKNKRGLLLEAGLIVALALVIGAFAYTPKEYRIKQVSSEYVPTDMDMVIQTKQEEPVAPKKIEVKAYSQILDIIKNDQLMPTEVPVWEFDPDDIVIPVAPVASEEPGEEEIFVTAETMPSFQGGDLNTFRKWVLENVKFPQIALENGVFGRVTLEFVVDKDGRLINIKVLQTPDRTLSEEAIRVLNKSPKWSPGKQRNQPVRVKYTLPVDFRVQN